MKGVLKIATIYGIPVQIHWSFSFIFFWVIYEGNINGLDWKGMLSFGLLILSLFVCVVLHEFGHALSAKKYGVGTKDITLSPIGGIARLNKMPDKPWQEFVVALAGPMVNVLIATILGIGLWLFAPRIIPALTVNPIESFSDPLNFVPLLFVLNVTLVLFNLLPAFPMDGGRILRSLLSMKMDRVRATKIASGLGRIMAVGFLFFAIYKSDFILGLISVFVYVMAAQEYFMVVANKIMSEHKIAEVMEKDFQKLNLSDTISNAIEAMSNLEKNFLIVDEWGRLAGALTGRDIQIASKKKDYEASVRKYMKSITTSFHASDSLTEIYKKSLAPNLPIYPVFEDALLVGVLNIKNLNKFIRNKQQNNKKFIFRQSKT